MKNKFLKSVLGIDGSVALLKACERAPILEPVLVPRAVLSWLKLVSDIGYEGQIPGIDNSFFVLNKNEYSSLDGMITIGDFVYDFNKSEIFHVAAAIGASLGIDGESIDPMLNGQDLSKLGKSIDLLIKAKFVSQEIHKELEKKTLDPSLGYKISHEHVEASPGKIVTKISAHAPSGELVGTASFIHVPEGIKPGHVVVDEDHQRRGIASAMYGHAQKITNKKILPSETQTDEGAALWAGNKLNPQFNKDEKGLFAKPKPPETGEGPTKQPAQSQSRGFPLGKNVRDHVCIDCGNKYFKNDLLVGCICISDLLKNSGAKYSEDYIQFDNADDESYMMFLRIFGEQENG